MSFCDSRNLATTARSCLSKPLSTHQDDKSLIVRGAPEMTVGAATVAAGADVAAGAIAGAAPGAQAVATALAAAPNRPVADRRKNARRSSGFSTLLPCSELAS